MRRLIGRAAHRCAVAALKPAPVRAPRIVVPLDGARPVLQKMHRRATAGIFTDRRSGHAFRPQLVLVSPVCMVKPDVTSSRKKKWLLPNFLHAGSASRRFSHA